MPTFLVEYEPQGLAPIESDVPSFNIATTTNLIHTTADFDDTTQEYLNGKFVAPTGLDPAGTVTFRIHGFSGTAAAAKNVAFDFDHAAVANDEDLDAAAYTTEASGDEATINNQNDLEQHAWTETVANLGWVVGDLVYFRISRKTASADNLVGDWRMSLFEVDIPIT